MAEHWIPKNLKKGALHHDLGVPAGEKIPVAKIREAAKGDGKTAKRARLALTFRDMDHKRKKGSASDEEAHRRIKNAAIEEAGE